jgi:hypothetical protein
MLDGIITFPTVSVFILMLNLRNCWFICILYWVFRAQADWIFILQSELPTKEMLQLPKKMPPQAYQTSQYLVPRRGIFLGKWRSTFAGSSDGKTNAQSACALNTL